MRNFSIFACATPTVNSTHRGFDYAFYLPLTALAWKRIGFESIVQIIGRKDEWENHPALNFVLDSLKFLNSSIIFIDAKAENRMMMAQTARIFASNMKEYYSDGNDKDYIILSDADLWPIRRSHYLLRENKSLHLVHSDCCGDFLHANQSYRMIPINIGARASTWRQILNSTNIVKGSEDVLKIFGDVFGEKVKKKVEFASDEWYYDQKYLSIMIDKWMKKDSNKNLTFDLPFNPNGRIDRSSWRPETVKESQFESNYYDSHLIFNGFQPERWSTIRPLIKLMYTDDSWQSSWCDDYAKQFYSNFIMAKKI